MILPFPQFLKHTPRVMLLAVHTALNGYMTMMMMMMKITGTKHLTIYHKTTIRSTYQGGCVALS